MRLLSDAVFRPRLTDEELNNAHQTIRYEIEDMQLRPEKEAAVLEMIHEAAWKNNTLGYSRYCTAENVSNVTRAELLKYMKATYVPERIVISGVGVDHKDLVDLTKEHFTIENTTWNKEDVSVAPVIDEPAVYTGGEVRVSDLSSLN